MKKISITLVALCACALPIGAQAAIVNNNPSESVTVFANSPTNTVTFTNTVFQSNDLAGLQISNVVTLLLTLQTNMEETLIVLSSMTTNATAIEVSSAVPGPPSPFPQPFGAPRTNAIQQTAIVM